MNKFITTLRDLEKKSSKELADLNEKADKVIKKLGANSRVKKVFEVMEYEKTFEHYSQLVDYATDEESCHKAFARYILEKLDCIEELIESMGSIEMLDLITTD